MADEPKHGVPVLPGRARLLMRGSVRAVEVAPALTAAPSVVDSGAGLSTFAPLKPSLEDVYLRCAADDGDGRVSVASEPVEVDRPAETIAPPWPMARAFAYDVRRWAGHKVAWLLTAPAALAVIGIHGRFGEQAADAAELESGVLASATAVTAFEALGRGLRAGLPLLTFLAVGLASQAIAGEYSQGTLRNVLLRPVTRVRVAAGKALSTLLAVLLGYGLLWGGAMAAAAWWFDFGDVTEILPNGELYVYVDAEGLWREVWPLVWAPLLPLAAYTGLGFLVGALSRRATVALVVTLLITAFLDVGRVLARSYDFEEWLPSAYLPSPLSDTSYVAYYLDAVTGAANAAFAYADTAVSHPALLAGAFFILAAGVLTRRSVS